MAHSGGCFIAVLGPSGSGKDTLINWLRPHLADEPGISFVRRTVTRNALADTEDHDTLSREDFAQAEAAGRFAVTWEAHGLRYGIPSTTKDHVAEGGVAIANGSRRALSDINIVFGTMVAVQLTVERDVLAGRLLARGRESAEEIAARLARVDERLPVACRCLTIDNSGPVERAGTRFLQFLENEFGLARPKTAGQASPASR